MPESNPLYSKTWQAALLICPTALVTLAFLYYPGVRTFELSLSQSRYLGTQPEFVGIDNYANLLSSDGYQQSLTVTALFTVVVVFGTLLVGLWIAFMIYNIDKLQAVYMIGAIWPYALPPAVAASIVMFLIHPNVGTVTHHLESLTGFHVDWRVSDLGALFVVSLVAVWKWVGYNVIFLIAALHTIPKSLVQSSRLDGVSNVRMLWKVYVPLISPTLIFLLVMNTRYAFFSTFPIIDIMTEGGPDGATDILIYHLYKDAFHFFNLGEASAQSLVLFAFVAVLMYVQLRITDRYAFYG